MDRLKSLIQQYSRWRPLEDVIRRIEGFKDTDFGKFHPAGSLGKKLILRVSDLMTRDEKDARVHVSVPLKDAIIELSKKGLGSVTVVDEDNRILGIITDGDLRRQLEKGADIYNQKVEEIMSNNPCVIAPDRLAVEALRVMKERNISILLVKENEKAVGTIRLQDIIGVGIVG